MTSAVSSTVPVEPAAGASSDRAGFAAGSARGLSALRTREERAGTVTVTLPSAAVTAPCPPYRKRRFAESTGTVTVFAVVALLEATRYSVRCVASVREKA